MRNRVLIITGYFDIFCGYQEILLAKELARKNYDIYVVSSNLINPIFSLDMLRKIGLKSVIYSKQIAKEVNLKFFIQPPNHCSIKSVTFSWNIMIGLKGNPATTLKFFWKRWDTKLYMRLQGQYNTPQGKVSIKNR